MAQQRASAPFEGLRYQVLAAAFRMHARGGPASLREFHYHWPDYQRLVMWKVCAAVSVLAPLSGNSAVQSLVVCKVPVARSMPSLWPQSGMHPAAGHVVGVCWLLQWGWSCSGSDSQDSGQARRTSPVQCLETCPERRTLLNRASSPKQESSSSA